MTIPAAWQNRLGQCAQRFFTDKWPAPPDQPLPSPEGQSSSSAGFMFSGNVQETVPKRLLLDSRLTPLERNAWLVFKILLDKQGFAVPRYQDLQPYLSMVPYGEKASKETVARVITNLRLTRWISLAARGRNNANGQIQGTLYFLHDEPMSAAEIVQLDNEYMTLVENSLSHANKSVRLVAQGAMADIQASNGELPTRLHVLAERLQRQSLASPDQMQHESELSAEPGSSESESSPKPAFQHELSLGSESELSEKSLVRNRASLSSDSEPGGKPSEINAVRNPNPVSDVQYGTVLCTNTNTVPYCTSPTELRWPPGLDLKSDDHSLLEGLQKLPLDLQQAVLDEAASRIAAGGIRSQAGYLQGLIRRAAKGDFKLWAAQKPGLNGTSPPLSSQPSRGPIREVEPTLPRGPQETSEVAKACLERMRAMVNGAANVKRS